MRNFVLVWGFILAGSSTFAQSKDSKSTDNEPIQKVEQSDRVSSTTRDWRFTLGGGFSTANANFPEATCSNCLYKTSVSLDYSAAATVLAEARWSPPRSERGWGFMGGLALESERKVDKVKIGGTTSSSSSDSKLRITTLYGNAVYQWGAWYLPFGLNIGMLDFKAQSTYNGSTDASSGLGTQVGGGYMFNDHWSVQSDLRYVAFKLSSKDASTGDTTDYGNGGIISFIVTGRFTF